MFCPLSSSAALPLLPLPLFKPLAYCHRTGFIHDSDKSAHFKSKFQLDFPQFPPEVRPSALLETRRHTFLGAPSAEPAAPFRTSREDPDQSRDECSSFLCFLTTWLVLPFVVGLYSVLVAGPSHPSLLLQDAFHGSPLPMRDLPLRALSRLLQHWIFFLLMRLGTLFNIPVT